MKYIKKFESHKKIKIGDYVIIKPNNIKYSNNLNIFIENHIGEIRDMLGSWIYITFIFTKNDSKKIKNEFGIIQSFHLDDIKYTSNNLEELKIKLNAEKYNL